MAQQLLDHAQVGSALEQMRRECVAQPMWVTEKPSCRADLRARRGRARRPRPESARAREQPVHGFATTPSGDPLDRYGRVLYLDTFDSAYGPGWRRENGFVSRNPDGTFCYGFVPHETHTGEPRPPAHGSRYRLAVSGPGVTPDIAWEGSGLHDFDPENAADQAHEDAMNALQRELTKGSKPCHD